MVRVVPALDFDYVVVGSGFGGSVSACRLAEKGYSVGVIEMGKRWKREDFPKTNWNLRKYFWKPWLGMYGILQMTLVKDAFFLHGAGHRSGTVEPGHHWTEGLRLAAAVEIKRSPSVGTTEANRRLVPMEDGPRGRTVSP